MRIAHRYRTGHLQQLSAVMAVFSYDGGHSSVKCMTCHMVMSKRSWQRRTRLPIGAEPDLLMRAVAERLRATRAASAQLRALNAGDDASGSADHLEVAADLQRTVEQWIDRERAVAHGEHVGAGRGRFAGRREADFMMRAVAVGLVLRCAAAAERGAIADGLPVETDL